MFRVPIASLRFDRNPLFLHVCLFKTLTVVQVSSNYKLLHDSQFMWCRLKSLMLLTAQGWLPHYWRLLMPWATASRVTGTAWPSAGQKLYFPFVCVRSFKWDCQVQGKQSIPYLFGVTQLGWIQFFIPARESFLGHQWVVGMQFYALTTQSLAER